MILLFDKIIRKILSEYRKTIFKKRIRCPHRQFTIVGKVYAHNCNITLGKNVKIFPDVMFWGDGRIVIGDNVNIGNGTIIFASRTGGVTIGDNTAIAAQCYIIDMDHGTNANKLIRNQSNSVSPIKIGSDVWIAANVTVLKGSVINDGAVVGAKSLVKGEIVENGIAMGIPAKVIKYRE